MLCGQKEGKIRDEERAGEEQNDRKKGKKGLCGQKEGKIRDEERVGEEQNDRKKGKIGLCGQKREKPSIEGVDNKKTPGNCRFTAVPGGS